MNEANKLSSISPLRLLFTVLVPTSLLLPTTSLFSTLPLTHGKMSIRSIETAATYLQLLHSHMLKKGVTLP